ncbi:MAG: guanine deaminase, partial [Betaproteobacteria bacterium]|nr:guanine deaminase [Betaproteobacteria bacterium]
MKAYRAQLLRFDDNGQPHYESDGLLVIGPDAQGRAVVRAAGSHDALIGRFAGVAVQDLRG